MHTMTNFGWPGSSCSTTVPLRDCLGDQGCSGPPELYLRLECRTELERQRSARCGAQGTKVCGLTDKIFSGHIVKSIECINVDFKSEKKDMFQDIMVDVKGCANVYDSFDRITAQDKLEGENQYDCEGHGKQVVAEIELHAEQTNTIQILIIFMLC